MNPKHKNPSPNRTDRIASAPYNFVPLPEVVVKAVDDPEKLPNHDTFANEGYTNTGYFEVTLTTKSPIYVRGPVTLEQFKRQSSSQYADGVPLPERGNPEFRRLVKNLSDFFHTDDRNQPVIPGSTLRGMLRNLLEIASYGKVQWVTDKRLFFRTVDNSAIGKYYNERLVSGNGVKGDGYRSETEGGFWRIRLDGSCAIETCTIARVENTDLANVFNLERPDALYEGRGPNATPKWGFQHRTVWVQTETSEGDHPHSAGKFLRYLKVTSIKTQPSQGHSEGTLMLTGPMQSKHMAFVFVPKAKPEVIPVPNDRDEGDINKRLVDRFQDEDQITPWQASAFPDDKPHGAERKRNGYLRDGEPVFLLRENGELTFFGRAQMFRLPYRNRPIDLVPPNLRRPEDIDYAEGLFGYVRTRKELEDMRERKLPVPERGKARAYASRVFVTDATTTQADVLDSAIVPRILATPKPTTFQHYLTQQEPNDKNALSHYDSSQEETALRGHKLYWHQGQNPSVAEQGNVDAQSTQHTQIRPTKTEKTFTFHVYFENLSDRELGALCWVLQPVGPAKEYCHNLGMGKPLGQGAVTLDATLYRTTRSTRYSSLFDGDTWQTGAPSAGVQVSDSSVKQQFIKPFEDHVLGVLKPSKPCQHLSDLMRIGMLLKMLEWPGYPPEIPATLENRYLADKQRANTRYMTVQLPNVPPRQRNEYRDRPVLPDPAHFAPQLVNLAEATVTASRELAEQSEPESLSQPTQSAKQYAIGDVFTGTVWKIYEDGSVAVVAPKVDPSKGYAMIPAAQLGGKMYQEGSSARCEIIKIYTASDGRTVFECKPGPKPPPKKSKSV